MRRPSEAEASKIPDAKSATEHGQGAQPQGVPAAGASGEAAAAVREMFNSIAGRYDLLNHVLSFNIDRLWWRRTARRFQAILKRPEARVLDICCGTGDLTLALLRHRPPASSPIVAADFAHQMLLRGAAKFSSLGLPARAVAIEADALHLPFRDNSFDLVTTAFGFRNLANYRAGLEEFHRVLAPGGELGILDFSEPEGAVGKLYRLYFRHVLPAVGSALSGVTGPYAYLPQSVRRFPSPPAMLELLREAGFTEASWTPYSFGIAGLYRAVKPAAANQ